MKKNICIVADVPNWAFDNIAKKLKKELSYKYNIEIKYFNRRKETDFLFEFIEENNNYDLIHFLNRRILLLMGSKTFQHKIKLSGQNINEYISKKKQIFTTSVNDHIDLEPKGIIELKPIYNEYTKKYYTSNKKLFDIYNSIPEFKNPDCMIHDICDEDIFVPINLNRFEKNNIEKRPIVIGWVGNSTHSDEKDVDLKGFHSIIKPVIEELINEGYDIKEHYANRNEKWRLPIEMPKYYSEIDLCLCASIHEGTPLPILEAMNCGVPIITTDVGLVSEVFDRIQKEFIIGDRLNGQNDENIKRNLKQKIMELYNNRSLFEELSKENLQAIKKIDSKATIKKFENFFDSCLE